MALLEQRGVKSSFSLQFIQSWGRDGHQRLMGECKSRKIHPKGREVHPGTLREASQADVPGGFVKELAKTSWDVGSVPAGVLGRGGSEAVRRGTPRQMEQHERLEGCESI